MEQRGMKQYDMLKAARKKIIIKVDFYMKISFSVKNNDEYNKRYFDEY